MLADNSLQILRLAREVSSLQITTMICVSLATTEPLPIHDVKEGNAMQNQPNRDD